MLLVVVPDPGVTESQFPPVLVATLVVKLKFPVEAPTEIVCAAGVVPKTWPLKVRFCEEIVRAGGGVTVNVTATRCGVFEVPGAVTVIVPV